MALSDLYQMLRRRCLIPFITAPKLFGLYRWWLEQNRDQMSNNDSWTAGASSGAALNFESIVNDAAATTALATAELASVVPRILHFTELCQTSSWRSQHDNINKPTMVTRRWDPCWLGLVQKGCVLLSVWSTRVQKAQNTVRKGLWCVIRSSRLLLFFFKLTDWTQLGRIAAPNRLKT